MNKSINMANDEETRSASRTNICLVAALMAGGKSLSVRIRNLSPSGALLDGPALPPAGADVELSRGPQNAAAKVVWSEDGRCGVHFADRLTVSDWLPGGSGNQNQTRTDVIVAQIRQGAARDVAHQSRQVSHLDAAELDRRLADEIAFAARRIEFLGDDIAKEPLFRARYSLELRNLDLIKEILGRVATVLRAVDKQETAQSLGMDGAHPFPGGMGTMVAEEGLEPPTRGL